MIPNEWLKCSSWSIDGTLKGTTKRGQSGLGSNCSEEILHIPQCSRTRASPSDAV